MTCYIVAFESGTPEGLKRIKERLKTFTGYCPITASCWAVLSDTTASAVREHIGNEGNDRIFVVRSGTATSWVNSYGTKYSEWLKTNL